jgi:hypothetical protein
LNWIFQANFLKEEQETVRNGLLKGSELSEDEVNEIMAQLTAGMAASEIKFSDQLGRQASVSLFIFHYRYM